MRTLRRSFESTHSGENVVIQKEEKWAEAEEDRPKESSSFCGGSSGIPLCGICRVVKEVSRARAIPLSPLCICHIRVCPSFRHKRKNFLSVYLLPLPPTFPPFVSQHFLPSGYSQNCGAGFSSHLSNKCTTISYVWRGSLLSLRDQFTL